MEDMAAMLNEVAGGLQQSFGTVFERVGQSLAQSANMMQMMNEMMEAALLQTLVATYEVVSEASSSSFAMRITIENRSQIQLSEVSVGLRFEEGSTLDQGTEEQALEQGLGAKTSVDVTVPFKAELLSREGVIRLAVRSPGTHQWLYKDVAIRIPVLKVANVQPVHSPADSLDGFSYGFSDAVSIVALREALGVSAFDPLMTSSTGYYRISVPAGVIAAVGVELAICVQQTSESPSGSRVVVAATSSQSQEESQRCCASLVRELEAL